MSKLEQRQRGLLDLMKSRGEVPRDPYLQRVAQSRELAMLRKIAHWWNAVSLASQCRLTARLLKKLGCFDAVVADYFNRNATSPFVEELTLGFLASLHDHSDPLIRATSQFELALARIRGGSPQACDVEWDRNPDRVFLALDSGGDLPAPEPGARYRMQVSPDLPGLVACVRELAVEPCPAVVPDKRAISSACR